MKYPSSFSPDAPALALTLNTLANTVAAYPDVYAAETGAAPSPAEAAWQYGQPERDAHDLYELANRLGERGLSPLVVGFTRRQFAEAQGRGVLVARPDTGSLLRYRQNFHGSTYFSVLTPLGIETDYAISPAGLRRDHGSGISGQLIKDDERLRIVTALESAVPHSRFMEDVKAAQEEQRVRIARWAARPFDLMRKR